MNILVGEPYCIGGCHGVFLDWLYMIKDRKKDGYFYLFLSWLKRLIRGRL
jgi:hypothetical protein